MEDNVFGELHRVEMQGMFMHVYWIRGNALKAMKNDNLNLLKRV